MPEWVQHKTQWTAQPSHAVPKSRNPGHGIPTPNTFASKSIARDLQAATTRAPSSDERIAEGPRTDAPPVRGDAREACLCGSGVMLAIVMACFTLHEAGPYEGGRKETHRCLRLARFLGKRQRENEMIVSPSQRADGCAQCLCLSPRCRLWYELFVSQTHQDYARDKTQEAPITPRGTPRVSRGRWSGSCHVLRPRCGNSGCMLARCVARQLTTTHEHYVI